jgi:O-antigen/teichoic acid export membrane protein
MAGETVAPAAGGAAASPAGEPEVGLARGTFLTLRADVALALSGLAVSIMVSRGLGPTNRGIYFLALLAGQLIVLLGDLGLSASGIAFGASREIAGRHLHAIAACFALLASFVGAAVLVGAAPFLTRTVLKGLDRSILALVAVGIAPTLYLQIMGAVLTGMGRIPAISLVRLAQALLLPLTLVPPLVVAGDDPFWAVAAWLATLLVCAAGLAVYLGRTGVAVALPPAGTWRRVFGFGLRGQIGNLAHQGFLRLDVFFISARYGPTLVGIYSLASVFAERISMLAHAVYAASARAIGSSARDEAAALTARIVRTVLVILVPAAALLAVVAHPLIVLIFGGDFGSAATPFRLLLPGTVCLTVWYIVSLNLISSLHRPGTTSLIQLGGLAVSLPLYLWAVDHFKMTGAALVSTGVYALVMTVGIVVLVRATRTAATDLIPRPADVRAVRDLVRPALSRLRRG